MADEPHRDPKCHKDGDPYADLAASYDLFHGRFGEYDAQETSFFRQLVADARIRRVLDCACGTGPHLPLFRSLDCEVVGSDISPALITVTPSPCP